MTIPTVAQNAPYVWALLADANGNPLFFNVPSTTSPATATGGTITTASVGIARITPVSNITGVILQAGMNTGQQIIVENQSAFWVQMATSGTSNVASGTSDYIAPLTAALYEWESVNSLWYRVDPPLSSTPFALYLDAPGAGSFSALTAGQALLNGIEVRSPITISQMRCVFSGVPSGNVDMGIYDATGTNGAPNNLLGHTGAIAATTGLFTKTLIANLTLFPGKYWLAFIDTVADSLRMVQTSVGTEVAVSSNSTALTVLPSTMSAVTTDFRSAGLLALQLNGWS